MRKRDKKTRIFVLIIAILLVVALVVPLFAAAISAAGEDAALTANEVTESSGEPVDEEPAEEDALAASAVSSLPSPYGVFIENVDITDMSLEEVEGVVASKLEEFRQSKIILYTDIEQMEVTAGDLGLTCKNDDIAREAYSIGREGNVFKRFLADHARQEGPIILDLELGFSETAVRETMAEVKKTLDRKPVPTGLKHEADGSFSLKEKMDGVTVDSAGSAASLLSYMNNVWHGGEGGMELNYAVIPAADETERLKSVKDLLGTFSTEYPTDNEGRVTNIELATSLIDGKILFPGEEFSFADVVGPTTEEAGFQLAGAYESGAVVQEYGGGICQVSSTLYMATLYSELEITERYPHTMTVTYLSPGMDAVINEGTFNYRFKNSTDAPIYIEGIAKDGKVTMSIYGKETREAGRTLNFESRTISQEIRPNQYYTNNTIPVGQIDLQEGRDGLQVELWKLIYMNGEYQTEEKANDSYYYVYPDKFTIGTQGATNDQLIALQSAIAADDLTGVYNAVRGYY